MSDNKHFSLGGFPPIYESVSYIKKKEYVPNNILSIQSILSKRGIDKTTNNANDTNDTDDWGEKKNDTDNFYAKQILIDMQRISKGKSSKKRSIKKKKASKK